MFGNLYTNNFSNIAKSKGIVISIARFNPKWLKANQINYWLKNLAPSIELLNKYKNNLIDWEEYVCLFNVELQNDNAKKQLNGIYNLLKKGNDVTILCYENKKSNCHRFIIANMFKSIGINVKELS